MATKRVEELESDEQSSKRVKPNGHDEVIILDSDGSEVNGLEGEGGEDEEEGGGE